MAATPPAPRVLVVNADDLGLSAGVNHGILHAHDHGIVTSASLMVRRPAARAAAEAVRRRARLGVGLHLDLGDWVFSGDRWRPSIQVVDEHDQVSVAKELEAQLAAFRRLIGRDPTHLDSHQHIHLSGYAGDAAHRLARQLGVSLRHRADGIRYCGDFHGQTGTGEPLHEAITTQALIRILRGLPPGVTELACHPGAGHDVASPYAGERELELRTLCEPRIREVIRQERIALRSFADLGVVGRR
jgi:predicted glycoside hydrolase/deacetylase ChbG (UPF0249 family)